MPTLQKKQAEGLAGGAGLIRYFDVDEGGPKLDPKLVVGIVITVILLEMFSHIIL